MAAVMPEPQVVATRLCRDRCRAPAKSLFKRVRRFERAVGFRQLRVRNIQAARDVPRPHARARLGFAARETIGAPRIDDLFAAVFQSRQHLLEIAHERVVRAAA